MDWTSHIAVRWRQLLGALCCVCCSVTHADDVPALFRVSSLPPPGFAELAAKQTTAADVYFGGELIATAFIEFDVAQVELLDPLSVIELIPNVKDVEKLANHLKGPRPTNAENLCNSRVREGCGELQPQLVDLIFDESRFRIDLFVNPDELLVHRIAEDRYLPPPSGGTSVLHNVRMSLSGAGDSHRFNIGSESFLAFGESRLRSRYGVSDEGASLYELAWQRDDNDMSYEVGSFRTLGRNLAFTTDLDVLGARVATSTKRRTDLEQVSGTALFLFLSERSRVDVFRGNELIDSRYYDAGNQQLDTSGYPDGAYELRLRIVGQSGTEREEAQFFVRSAFLPPMHEPQYYLEAGSLMSTLYQSVPRLEGGAWVRGGASHRLRQNLSLDNELIYVDGTALWQSGAFVLAPSWHLYAGGMVSSDGDHGIALRGGVQRGEVSASFDVRRVDAARAVQPVDQFALINGSYTQGTATLAFPLGRGRFYLRGRVNDRYATSERGVGFSYWRSFFVGNLVTANLMLDGNYSQRQSWLQVGVQVRWTGHRQSASLTPKLRTLHDDEQGSRTDALVDGRWNTQRDLPGVGRTAQSLYLNHDDVRSAFGVRLDPEQYPNANLEVGLARSERDSQLYYAANNRFSVVSADGYTTMGDGGSEAGAIIVQVHGPVQGRFEVLVDDRVVGQVWANSPNVFSLRPYASYDVRIRPIGDQIVGFDEQAHRITLYPGKVQGLQFAARALTVLIGQAIDEGGRPVSNARFANVEGFGATDEQGWFQVEISTMEPLRLEPRDSAAPCQIVLPEVNVEKGLAMVDQLVCSPIPAQR